MTKTVLKTKVHRGTWMGRPGTSNVYHLDRKPTGLRVVTQHFDGCDLVEVKLVDGDGRNASTFREINKMEVPARVVDAVVADMVAAA